MSKQREKIEMDMPDLGLAVQMNTLGNLIPTGTKQETEQTELATAKPAPQKPKAKPKAIRRKASMNILDDIKAKPKKTARMQLVMHPELFEAIKEQAKESGRSVNDFVCTVVSKVIGFDK